MCGQLLCVFDGHGDHGHLVSQRLRTLVPQLVWEHASLASDPALVLRECLARAERLIIADPAVETGLSGSTAVVALIQTDRITIASVVRSNQPLAPSPVWSRSLRGYGRVIRVLCSCRQIAKRCFPRR